MSWRIQTSASYFVKRTGSLWIYNAAKPHHRLKSDSLFKTTFWASIPRWKVLHPKLSLTSAGVQSHWLPTTSPSPHVMYPPCGLINVVSYTVQNHLQNNSFVISISVLNTLEGENLCIGKVGPHKMAQLYSTCVGCVCAGSPRMISVMLGLPGSVLLNSAGQMLFDMVEPHPCCQHMLHHRVSYGVFTLIISVTSSFQYFLWGAPPPLACLVREPGPLQLGQCQDGNMH